MSKPFFELDASLRDDKGKGASRRLRREDKVPAILYGAGEDAKSLILDHKKLLLALEHESFYSRILTLHINGKAEKVVLKNIQRHPFKPRIAHMDFLRIKADQKLHMSIPLHFIGEANAVGVKEGGIISHLLSDVEVSCLPADLPEYIEVDVSGLALNETIHLSQLQLPKNVELVALSRGDAEAHDLPVVSIHIPRAAEETASAVASAEATAEAAKPESSSSK